VNDPKSRYYSNWEKFFRFDIFFTFARNVTNPMGTLIEKVKKSTNPILNSRVNIL
jgi:hypothetical protein